MAANPRFNYAVANMKAVVDSKNDDYAEDGNPFSNFEFAAEVAGITVMQDFLSLIGTKLARIRELTGTGKVPNNESLEDSLLDLANYATLMYAYTLPEQYFEPDSTVRYTGGDPMMADWFEHMEAVLPDEQEALRRQNVDEDDRKCWCGCDDRVTHGVTEEAIVQDLEGLGWIVIDLG